METACRRHRPETAVNLSCAAGHKLSEISDKTPHLGHSFSETRENEPQYLGLVKLTIFPLQENVVFPRKTEDFALFQQHCAQPRLTASAPSANGGKPAETILVTRGFDQWLLNSA